MLAQGVAEMFSLATLKSWWTIYDYDAVHLTRRERLARLEYAACKTLDQSGDSANQQELEVILDECRALVQLETLDGETAEGERVGQRMERIRRVIAHHEGGMSRLNRRFWWMPFSVGLVAMAVLWLQALLAL